MKRSALMLGGLLLALTGSAAFAQAPSPAPPAMTPAASAAPAAGADESGNPFTVANIDPLKPFGEITIEEATSPDQLAAFEQKLTEAQVTELDQRCTVIKDATEFAAEPRAFCDMWAIVRADEMGDPAAAAITTPAPGGGVTQVQPPAGGAATPAPAAP